MGGDGDDAVYGFEKSGGDGMGLFIAAQNHELRHHGLVGGQKHEVGEAAELCAVIGHHAFSV
ncbi:hypothetical protein A3A64_02875 [Candidatus Gottesmanbacteria bacterium RIFCSPLOWO2_01_FULL_48_11]|uniref:Uncharacterized protein n=1 Tax=Candidatus Gottesmanbacteria bacterium RIFCSPLOWO2_01_FULL_48_11 TaxID=1798395 RepID=A0A1F6ASV2_9BACT|nr:MAG: hypothetical protein A3A64_02875 [Candidatus Gottesmanbacteria bacterium RIFCSPLOWO2_01_FULL_48_11]